MTPPIVSIRGLSKVFPSSATPGKDLIAMLLAMSLSKGKAAVNNVDLDIKSGERLGIVGRNGAGKSTLLHLLAGLSAATSGQIGVTGKVTSVLTLGVGLRDEFSGRENIYVDGEIQGKSRAEIDLLMDDIIAFADIGSFIEQPVRTYSTGMKARLAFSMIAHIDPEILIIDEALSVGDAAFSLKATQRIREICAKGKIVIIVSHSMQAIREICNRCLWMDSGKIVMDGSPEQVTNAYLEAVRAGDEVELREKFQRLIGGHSYAPGYEISQAALFDDSAQEPRLLLQVGRMAIIKITAVAALGSDHSAVRALITRLDGLVMFDEYFDTASYLMPDGSVGLEIEMPTMVVCATVYRLDVYLLQGVKVLAERTNVFETYTLNAPAGGKPMLQYPATAISSSIEQY